MSQQHEVRAHVCHLAWGWPVGFFGEAAIAEFSRKSRARCVGILPHSVFLCQVQILGCREPIICPVFVARDLSGLGCALKEGHYDTGESTTGGETDAV